MMDRIIVTAADIEKLLAWRDEHKELVRLMPVPLREVKIQVVENGISIKRLHVVERHKFFCTGSVLKGKHRGERFYGTRDEAEVAAKTRSDRAVAIYMSACPSVMTSRAAKIAERYISRVTGIKHPNRAKLNVRHAIRRDDGRVYGQYIVTYNGKSYILH